MSGGGSHGVWQASCIQALAEAGVEFHDVAGFSIGSFTGAAYALGKLDLLAEQWREMDRLRILRREVRFHAAWMSPISFYSGGGVAAAMALVPDDEEAKRVARCRLTVVAHRVRDVSLAYATFDPKGRWDATLRAHLTASCAVPWIFPPALLDGRLYVDGGMPGLRGMRFDALADCDAVVSLLMTRPEEHGALGAWFRRGADQLGREMCHVHVNAALSKLPQRTKVHRLTPSRLLEYDQMDFSSKSCGPALELGRADARAFLADLAVPAAA